MRKHVSTTPPPIPEDAPGAPKQSKDVPDTSRRARAVTLPDKRVRRRTLVDYEAVGFAPAPSPAPAGQKAIVTRKKP